jgi:hypothetical protein
MNWISKKFRENSLLIALILIVFGVFGIILSIYKPEEWDIKTAKLLMSISQPMLVSGVFAVFLKILQFNGIFKEELTKVIYSPEHLAQRKDVEELWNNASDLISGNPFPHLRKKIYDVVRDDFLKVSSDYLYENIHRDIHIGWHDKDKGIIVVKTTIEGFIHNNLDNPTDFQRKHTLEKLDGISLPNNRGLDLGELKFDDNVVKVTEKVVDLTDRTRYELKVEMPKKQNFKYEETYTTYQDINKDPVIAYIGARCINNLSISVSYNESDLKISFSPIGTPKFKKFGITNKGTLKRKHNDLIFAKQGYMLTISGA